MTEYQRGYGKGYNTGCRRSDAALAAERNRADRAAERAERAESATSIGHCEECRFWVRQSPRYVWGVCQVPSSAGSRWGTWAQTENGGPVSTTLRFGCVLFLPLVTTTEPACGRMQAAGAEQQDGQTGGEG